MSAIEAVRANGQALALTLAEVGINVDAAPVLDLLHPGADAIVGDRAFGARTDAGRGARPGDAGRPRRAAASPA